MARKETRSSDVTRTCHCPCPHLRVKSGLTMAGVNVLKGLELTPMKQPQRSASAADGESLCLATLGHVSKVRTILRSDGRRPTMRPATHNKMALDTTLVYHIRHRTHWDSNSDPTYFQTAFIAVLHPRTFHLFLHSTVCLTRCPLPLPKRVLHRVRSCASCSSFQDPAFSLRLYNSCLSLFLVAFPSLLSFLLSFLQ
jgi:hypothetical protein